MLPFDGSQAQDWVGYSWAVSSDWKQVQTELRTRLTSVLSDRLPSHQKFKGAEGAECAEGLDALP